MKTLKDFTEAIVAAGCTSPRMERSYKRREHREVLVFAWLVHQPANKKLRKAQAETVFEKLRAAGFELIYAQWDYVRGESTCIAVQAKVALADEY